MIYVDFVGRRDLIPRPPINKFPELPTHQINSIDLSVNELIFKLISAVHPGEEGKMRRGF